MNAPDDKELFESSKIGVEALKNVHGTQYTFGGSCETIYQSSGTPDDHFYALRGVKYSMTVELRDMGTFGFLLPASQIIPVGEETVEGFFAHWAYVESQSETNGTNAPIGYAEPPPTNYLLPIVIVAVSGALIGVLLYYKKRRAEYLRK